MLPAIEYLLTLRESAKMPGIHNRVYQTAIVNFPPLTTINYSVSPTNAYCYILYEFTFGEAMVPHSFDVKVLQAGQKILDVVISGRFTTGSIYTFISIQGGRPADFYVTNMRNLVNYYELTAFYLAIPDIEHYNAVVDALRRMHTSTKIEELAKQCRDILNSLTIGGR